jgi:hypothetical protein
MPTWADLYGDVYDVPPGDLPEGFIGDGPIYPDKIYKSGQIIGDELISPDKQGKNKRDLLTEQPERSSKVSTDLDEEAAMPRVQAKKKAPVTQQSRKSTKTQNRLFFGVTKPSKRSNEI